MPLIARPIATQYVRLAIWNPQERALTALALSLLRDASLQCVSVLEAIWPGLRLRLDPHHARLFAANLAFFGEFEPVGFLLRHRRSSLTWPVRADLAYRYALARIRRAIRRAAATPCSLEQMVHCMCRCDSMDVRGTIESTLRRFRLEAACWLMAAFADGDLAARVRIVRLLAALTGEHESQDLSASVITRHELQQIVLAAARDPQWALRAAAADALQYWNLASALDPLLTLLFDESLDVVEAAFGTVVGLAMRGQAETEALTLAMLKLEVSPAAAAAADHVGLLIRALRLLEDSSTIRNAIDQDLISTTLRPHVVDLLDDWTQPGRPEFSQDSLNPHPSGDHTCGCQQARAASGPACWLTG